MDQFCLKWNNFQSSLVTAFGNLQSTEELADVTLTCEGQSIKAHKIILSACSPYFRNVFKDNPCPHPIVILKDVLYSDLLAILNFMYHGEVLIAQDKLASFLQTAQALKVSGLVSNSSLRSIPVKYVQHPDGPVKKIRPKKPPPKQEREGNVDAFLENIKTEMDQVDDIEYTNNNLSDKSDAYDKQSSMLETALEVKDDHEFHPSILERSLTSQTTQQATSLEHTKSEIDQRGTKHKVITDVTTASPDLPQKLLKSDDDSISNDITLVNLQSFQEIPQPHHSSQCGNCPHCGKVYSNQSALKYHVRLVHSDLTNMYCCHLCPEAFDFREGYKKHMADAHSVRN